MSETSGWRGTLRGMPEPGAAATRSKHVTERDVALFTELSGDHNPLHHDAAAARQSVFGGLIAHGGITTSILNALVAEDLPGPGSVFLSMELKFVKAVFLGDTITGRVTLSSVRADKPICTLELSIINQHGETCVSGTASTYTTPLRHDA